MTASGRDVSMDGTAPEPASEGAFSRRGLLVAGIATGAAVVWSAPFPFADAVIGQGVAYAGGTTGPTGPTGPAESTGATGTAVPVVTAALVATGSSGGVKRKASLRVRHTTTERKVHPGQWFGQTVIVTAHGSAAKNVSISMPTPPGFTRVAGKATRTAAVVRPGHSLRLQTVYIAKPEAVGRVATLQPKVAATGITTTSVSAIRVTVVPKP